jgi:hypothetical protein
MTQAQRAALQGRPTGARFHEAIQAALASGQPAHT